MSNQLDFVTGDWVVRVTELQLENLKSGNVTPLEPRVAALLSSLVSRQGGLVTKQMLLEEVWQGSVVSDDSIAQAVSRLRKLLGDDPKAPKYIETVWKKGYRWIPTVNDKAFASSADAVEVVSVNKKPLIAGAIIACLIGFIVFMPTQKTAPPIFDARPLTSSTGSETRGMLSPDGKNVVYQHRKNAQAKPQIMMQDTQGGASQILTTQQQNVSPIFSPDGNRVAYIQYLNNGNCQIMIKGLVSGLQSKAGDCTGSVYADLDWSADGQQMALGLRPTPSQPNAIFILKADKLTQVSFPPADAWGDFDPVFSTDGGQIAFTRAYTEMQHDLFITSADEAKAEQRLTERRSAIMGSTFTPDNDALVYATRRGVRYQLQKMNLDSRQSQPISLAATEVIEPNIAANGDMVATVRRFDTDLYRVNPKTGQSQQLFDSTHWDLSPMISPNGKHFVFTSNRNGFFQLWLGDLGTGKTRPVTNFEGNFVTAPRFSPDSTRVVFEVHQGDHSNIHTYSLDSGLLLQLTDHESNNVFPSVSIDAQQLYFGSNRSGQWQIWRQPMDGGKAIPVTQNGGFVALASYDGRWFYFSKHNEAGLWRKGLNDGEVTLVSNKLQADDPGAFAISNQGVVFVDRTQGAFGRVSLVNHSLETRQLYQLTAPIPRFDPVLAVDADLGFVYLVRNNRIESDLIFVEGAFGL